MPLGRHTAICVLGSREIRPHESDALGVGAGVRCRWDIERKAHGAKR